MISDGAEVSIRRSEVGLQLLKCRCSGGGKRLNTRPIGLGQIFSPVAEGTNQVLAPPKRNLNNCCCYLCRCRCSMEIRWAGR